MNPTGTTYGSLQYAYSFFNERLFNNELPNCLITLQRQANAAGYFRGNGFSQEDSEKYTDEIAINPEVAAQRSMRQVMSTLVHEQVHLWQKHFGKMGRGGYHNKQWANKMESIGLMPSHNGLVGGKRTGDSMTHYIIEGGAFDLAFQELEQDENFKMEWRDTWGLYLKAKREERRRPTSKVSGGDDDDQDGGEDGDNSVKAPLPPKQPTRAKFQCPKCKDTAWGSPMLKIACVKCDVAFEWVGGRK